MADDDFESNLVSDPCPQCSERRADCLVWEDDLTVRCSTCGTTYRPGDQSVTNS